MHAEPHAAPRTETPAAPRLLLLEEKESPHDSRPPERNHVLRLLARESRAAYEQLDPLLETVACEAKDVLYEPGEPIPFVYFPQSCVCSVVKIMADGRRVEVSTIGREGIVGLPVFLGGEVSSTQCFVQVPGELRRLSVAAFRTAAAAGTTLHGIVQRFARYVFDQVAQSVACNRLHAVERRCARWILMTHDGVDRADTFPLTHEFLAQMLGVRRASVSVAAEALRRAKLIRYSRGKIAVLDRAGLEAASCECYATMRARFDGLLGQPA